MSSETASAVRAAQNANADKTIEVRGLRELQKRLKVADKDLVKAVKAVSLAAAEQVAEASRPLAPHRSGSLAAASKAKGLQSSAVVKNQLRYAGPIHFGWIKRNIKPQPFLYEALDARRDEVVETYERGLAEVLDRAFPD